MTGSTLKHRLLLIRVVSSGLALLFAAAVFLTYEYFHLYTELEEDTNALGRLVAYDAGAHLAAGNVDGAGRLLESLSTQNNVVAATLLDSKRKVVARYVHREADAPIQGTAWGGSPLEGMVWARTPVRHGGEEVGELMIAVSGDAVLEHLMREMGIGGAVIVPAFVLAFLGSIGLQRRILAPVERLVRLASRELNIEPDGKDAHDELQMLSNTFQRMVKSLRERERGLEEAELYFRALIEGSADMIAVLDADGRVRYNGPSCERVFGLAPGDFLGRLFTDFVHVDDRGRIHDALESVRHVPGGTFSVSARFVGLRGRQLELECVGRNELDTSAIAGVILNCRDVTERHASEQALRNSERRYRELVEHAADAFFMHDEHGRLLDVNQHACESLGYTREELLGMSVPDFELNTKKLAVQGIWDGLRPSEPVTLQGCHRRKDGSTFPVEVRVGVFASGPRGERRMVALARDISERVNTEGELKRARDAAEEADRAKSLFLANVSHEIRTPLTSILGMSELLQHAPHSADREHYVHVIRGSCDALMSVIDGILDLSRAEAGTLVLEKAEFGVRELAEGVQDMISPAAHRKGVDLVSLVERNVPAVMRGDADRLRQVLTNLLSNAVKFTDRGHVRMRIAVLDDRDDSLVLHVSVRDSGIGIGETERGRLFEPFVRGDDAVARRRSGAGLGLSISKFLVERMGGTIGAQPNVGGGSLFWFTARLEKSLPGTIRAPAFRHAAVQGLRLLVADHSNAVREVVAEHAHQWGMTVVTAGSADDALHALRTAARAGKPFDLLLADIGLEDMPGAALVEAVASDPNLATTQPALLTRIGARLDGEQRTAVDAWPQMALPTRQSRFGLDIVSVLHPVERPSATRAEPDGPLRAPGPQRKVLLVEDDTVSREALALLLQTLHCDVTIAADGREAMQAIARKTFDLVLMDWQMPVMNGLEATTAIRAMEGTGRRTRIVGVTASSSRVERAQCRRAGMDSVLRKPVTLQRLQEVLNEVPLASTRPPPASPSRALAAMPQDARGKLWRLFTTHARRSLEEMYATLDTGDTRKLREQAHALAGAAGQVGASTLSRACKSLEESTTRGDLAETRSLLRRVDMALEAVLRESPPSAAENC
jgi:PAS domain S-box-containing protein